MISSNPSHVNVLPLLMPGVIGTFFLVGDLSTLDEKSFAANPLLTSYLKVLVLL